MSYAQLDEHFDEHPKFAALELEHFGLMACAIAYCNRLLTDGFVATKAVRGFGASGKGPKVADQLVAAGIWEKVDGGYRVVGFLDHNPSRVTVLSRREDARLRKERSRNAGVTPPVTVDVTRDKTRDEHDPSRVSHDATALHCTADPDPQAEPPKPPEGAEPAPKLGTKRKRRTAIQADWKPGATLVAQAETLGLDVDLVIRDFVNFWLSEAKPKGDWERTFANNLDRIMATDTLFRRFKSTKPKPTPRREPAEPVTYDPPPAGFAEALANLKNPNERIIAEALGTEEPAA